MIFPKRAPQVSINDRFYKVFCSTFLQAPKHSFTNAISMLLKTTFHPKTTLWTFLGLGPESRPRISPETQSSSSGQRPDPVPEFTINLSWNEILLVARAKKCLGPGGPNWIPRSGAWGRQPDIKGIYFGPGLGWLNTKTGFLEEMGKEKGLRGPKMIQNRRKETGKWIPTTMLILLYK